MTINEYLKATRTYREYNSAHGKVRFENLHPHVICADGFEVSIQASEYHYCEPRINGAEQYEAVELGFPNMEEPLLAEYAEDSSDLTGTVYGYVPVEIVDKMIEKHGGIVNI